MAPKGKKEADAASKALNKLAKQPGGWREAFAKLEAAGTLPLDIKDQKFMRSVHMAVQEAVDSGNAACVVLCH